MAGRGDVPLEKKKFIGQNKSLGQWGGDVQSCHREWKLIL